ncbi:MAG: hypothetical protein AW07_01525 [Candidatus Accumulibacter sp. SK-11]|nr:MAG: hypothetical protein AW07_01525 [Candidatus Accumulibacter sp. SK-11]
MPLTVEAACSGQAVGGGRRRHGCQAEGSEHGAGDVMPENFPCLHPCLSPRLVSVTVLACRRADYGT